MKDLDDAVRMIVEKNIDEILKEPKKYEVAYRSLLRQQGIEPNLEAILSFMTGMMAGLADGLYFGKYDRMTDVDEKRELIKLFGRRAFEIRQAFV